MCIICVIFIQRFKLRGRRFTNFHYYYDYNQTVQLSSVQFKALSMCSEKPIIMRFIPSLRSFPNAAFETVPVFVWLKMALSSFQERPSSASSFLFPRLSAPGDRCPLVVSHVPQHFTSAACDGSLVRQLNNTKRAEMFRVNTRFE